MVVLEHQVKCLGNNDLKGQQHSAQGNTLGNSNQRVFPHHTKTQGDALGYKLIGLSGRTDDVN